METGFQYEYQSNILIYSELRYYNTFMHHH